MTASATAPVLARPARSDRLAPLRSMVRDSGRRRLTLLAAGLAVALHVLLAAVLVHPPAFLRATPVPPPPPREVELQIENDQPAMGDAQAGGTQLRATRPAPATPPPPAPAAPPAPNLPIATNGEAPPPSPGVEQPRVTQSAPPQPATPPEPQQSEPRISLSDSGDSGEESGGSAETPATPDPHRPNKLPRYPTSAAMARQSGEVDMVAHVLPDGSVSAVIIANSSGSPALDATATGAVRRWHFQPGQSHGQPIATDVPVRLNFVLH